MPSLTRFQLQAKICWLCSVQIAFFAILCVASASSALDKQSGEKPQRQGSKTSIEGKNTKDSKNQGKENKNSDTLRRQNAGHTLVLFRRIDPQIYTLGPGDGLQVNLWGAYDSFEEVQVSADGKLTLPTIGEFEVSGLTVRQTEELIKLKVKQYYNKNVQAGLALSSLRSFKVPVLGAVANPGHYDATLDTRVSDLLDQAGGLLPSASQRHVQVKNGEGVRIEADLIAYLRLGSIKDNPSLVDGDHIFVPPGQLVSVWIMDETTPNLESPMSLYEIKDGLTLQGLIQEMGGVNPAWDLKQIHIVRTDWTGQEPVKRRVDLGALMVDGDTSKDMVLHHGDYIFFARRNQLPYLDGNDEVVGGGIPRVYRQPSSNKDSPASSKRSDHAKSLSGDRRSP